MRQKSKILPYLIIALFILLILTSIIDYNEISARINAPDSDGELSTWEFIKTCLIILVSFVMIMRGKFWLFLFFLILFATILPIFYLGFILNLNDITFSAGIIFALLYIGLSSLKDLLRTTKN